jgi:predicted dehydrogenase
MVSTRLRVGIISANWGMIAHLPAWLALEGIEVVAVCTSRRETAQAAAATYGIAKAYWDHAAMARDPDIDIIDIGTRPDLRYGMVMEAIRNGKHIFASANFAANLPAARKMRDAAREARIVGALDSVLPWNGAHRMVKHELASGAAGRPISVSTQLVINLFNRNPQAEYWRWFGTRSHGASALRNLGTHSLHLLTYLLGPIEAVAGHATIALKEWNFTDGTTMRPEVEDTAQLLLRFANGTMGSMSTGWSAAAITGWRMELSCENATYVTHDEGYFPTHVGVQIAKGGITETPKAIPLPPEFADLRDVHFREPPTMPQSWDIVQAMQDFVRAIRQGGAPLPSFEDAYHVEAVLEAARQAIDNRSWVDVVPLGR